jgi:putative methyltransferase (TIGR04325 family)
MSLLAFARRMAGAVSWRAARSTLSLVGGGAVFRGDYSSWGEAARDSSGYSAPKILDKALNAILKVKSGEAAYERDTVLFDYVEYSYPLLAGLLLAGSREGRLAVLDFGGALGSSYFQNRRMLEHVPGFRWGVVEQPQFVACGRDRVADTRLSFHQDIPECVETISPNFALLSGVISYVEEPLVLLNDVFALALPFVCLDRSFVSLEGGTRLTVQVVPPWIYEASYPCWILDEQAVLARAKNAYRLVYDFPSVDGGEVRLEGLRATFKGYLFAREDVARELGVR